MIHRGAGLSLTCGAVAVLSVMGLGGCGATALQTTTPPTHFTPAAATVIFDCAGRAQARPASIDVYCADAGEVITAIRWTNWGTATATGVGRAVINTCHPDCVEGHDVTRAVSLRVTGLSLDGTSATYTTLQVHGAGAVTRFSLTINGPVAK